MRSETVAVQEPREPSGLYINKLVMRVSEHIGIKISLSGMTLVLRT